MAIADTRSDPPSPSPFWRFSLRIYGSPGVPPACLVLQDNSGPPVDVNIVLFCLFCAHQGRALSLGDAHRIIDLAEPWRREVVVALRQARRALKEPPEGFSGAPTEALRQKVKAVELEAERLQQESLFAGLPVADFASASDSTLAARENLMAYEAALGAQFDRAAMDTLLAAVHALKDQHS